MVRLSRLLTTPNVKPKQTNIVKGSNGNLQEVVSIFCHVSDKCKVASGPDVAHG